MVVTLSYHLPAMELRHLRYFVAVAEELSFRKAAQRLHVSRPALSKQIKDLEAEISVKLLERDTVSVSLTKAGEIFLEDTQKLLTHAEHAIKRANEAQSGHLGKLRIGSVGVIATDFLPKTLKLFHQHFPGVEVGFVEMLPIEQLEALASGKIDVGFAYGRDVENLPHLVSLCVIHSTYGIAVPKHHSLATKKKITLKDLRNETILCVGGNGKSGHRDAICEIYQTKGVKPGKYRQIDGFESMVTLIAADQGVSFLPHVLDLSKQEVIIIPLDVGEANLDFHMWAVWRRDNLSHHVKHFVRLLEERVQETTRASA